MSFLLNENTKTILNNSNEFILIINSIGDIIFINQRVESQTDISIDDNLFDYISEENILEGVRESNAKKIIHISLNSKLNFLELEGNVSYLNKPKKNDLFILSLSEKLSNPNTDNLSKKIFESESKYQKLIELSPNCIILHKNGIIEYVNKTGIKMLGAKSADEIIGRTNISFVHDKYKPIISERIREIQTIKQFTSWAEQKFVKLNGETIIVEAAATAIEINGEKVIQLIVKDITERKEFERQLIHNEQQLSAFLKAIPDNVYIIDENGKYMEIISSIQNKSKKGESIFDIFNENIAFKILKTIRKTIEHKKTFSLEYNFKNNYFEGRTAYLKNEEDKKRVLWISRDISTRKKAETLIKDNEDTIQNFLHQSSDGIYIVNNDGKIIQWNKTQEKITGYKQSEVLNKFVWNIQWQLLENHNNPPLSLKELKENTILTLKNKEDFSSTQTHTIDIKTKDGKIKTIKTVIFPIDTENGRKIGLIARDITQIKEIEDNLIKSKKLAEEANQAKSLFIAKISHEIRTPLNGIIGFTNLLLENELDKEKNDMLSLIKISSETLSKLITDILDFSKIESGKISLQHNEFDLNKLLESTIKSFNISATKKSLKLTYSNHNQYKRLFIGDKICLQQIMINLLSNAVKYTDKGSIHINIETTPLTKPNLRNLILSIKDTGKGIAPNFLQNIFSDVFKITYTDSSKGSGLGLSIVSSLVKLMNGKIDVISKVNEGSTFTINIPLELSRKTKETNDSSYKSKEMLSKQLRILVAEDDLTNQHLIKALAKNKPWELIIVDNGEKAISQYQIENIDLILMDIQMPIMNGIEATKNIRNLEKENNKHTPIIALTAYAMENDKQKCFDAGMDAFLAKPININKLYSTIDRYVK